VLREIAAADTSDFDAALRRVLKANAAALDVARVGFWQLTHDPFRLTLLANYLGADDRFEKGVELLAADYPRYFGALDSNPLIVASDAQSDPRTSEFAESYLRPKGISSMMDVPVWSSGRLVGVLCHEHVGAPRHWGDEERTFALSIGTALSAMLEMRARREAERRLDEVTADVAEARRIASARADLLAVVSHDLRAPLASICTTTELIRLDSAELTQHSRARLQRIGRAVRLMDRLINDLVESSRLETGHALPLVKKPYVLDAIVADAVDLLHDVAHARPVALTTQLAASAAPISCDRDRIVQVLANLVENAIRFTRPGGTVAISTTLTDECARIGVRDEGPGIPAEDQGHVFERWWRGARGHTGLGLYIAKAIVDAHHGRIQVSSSGAGTTFEFELPR
jgi:signal transduction histidine kinase